MRQLIIARKDLNMSAGKLAAQVSHASMAFISDRIRHGKRQEMIPAYDDEEAYCEVTVVFNDTSVLQWFDESFVKTVCEAKNKNQLLKAVEYAQELGLKQDQDFYLIEDNCLTELTPEENGTTLTCIGFRPLPDDIAHEISRHYQLYK